MCIMSMSGWGAAEQSAPDDPKRRLSTAPRSSVVREGRRGVSTLMYGCQQGNVESVRRVLHVQPFIAQQRDRTGKSAIHYCCTSDNKRAAQAADLILMAAPDLVDGPDEDGFTPLHLAVIAGNLPLVTFLLASKADVNAVDSEKHTVVHWATVCGETDALRACLAAGAPVSTPDVHGGFPLHYAAQMCGGEKDHLLGIQVLQTLLSHSDITVTVEDGDGRQPLLWAASAGSTRAMLALIRAGSAVESSDKDGLTALHCAASRGHTDCLDTLLTLCGASVDVIDSNGCTALHYAVTLGHADATALLLAHGANANRQDRKGRSPAHCGCAKGQLETVKMLGTHGANLWLRNARGDLPLHEAASSGRRDLVKWLLEARPSQVNARNNDGRCPLHLAALNDNADMCKILMDLGAQVNPVLRTSKNTFMTPLDCALQRGFRSTAKYLQLQGGYPANRIGNMKQPPESAVSLQIRDDVTFWGDTTTDSDPENVNDEEKRRKRSYKRKLAYRFERKQSGSDPGSAKAETKKLHPKEKKSSMKRQKAKDSRAKPEKVELSPKEKISYSSEVKISDRTENINVEQNGTVTINKDTSPKKSDTESKIQQKEIAEVRPKSVKPARTKDKPKQEVPKKKVKADTPDPRRKITLEVAPNIHTPSTPHTPQKTINENIREIESLALSIEEKAKSICKEVNTIDHMTENPDLQSLTSYEDGEHQNIVVEASVHPPPTSKKEAMNESKTNQEDMYKEVIMSLKEELDSLKNEIKLMKEDGKTNAQIDKTRETMESASIIEASKSAKDVEVLKELKDLLEGRIQEIKDTVEEFKVDIKNVIKTTDNSQCVKNDFIETINAIQVDIDETKKLVEASKIANEVAVASKIEVNDVNLGNTSNQQVTTDEVIEEVLVKSVDERALTNTMHEEDKIEKISEEVQMESAGVEIQEAIIRSEASKQEDVHAVETLVGDPNDVTTQGEEVVAADTIAESTIVQEDVSEVSSAKIEETVGDESPSKSDSVNDTTLDLSQAPDETESKILEEVTAVETVETTVPEIQTEISEADQKKPSFLKSEKQEHHLHLMKPSTPQDSSIDARSSGEEASDASDSSTASVATKREHKSFTVLDEGTRSNRRKERKGSKKSRSRSEETRLMNKENLERGHERLRRSKIPTALSKSSKDSEVNRRSKSNLESRVPILPNLTNNNKTKSETNLAGIRDYSDNERTDEEPVDVENTRKRKTRRKTKTRSAKSVGAGSDYESSNLIDSGFEPSPRSSRIPKWKNVSDRGVNMTSVTQSIQGNIRRYHLERKIFQHLLDLKRMQIRAGQHNEGMLVKRAIDSYHRSCAATVGAGKYVPRDFTFKSFEHFLYDSLRKIQKNLGPEYLKGLPESALENPMLCTQSTNRCMHATHAYTGIPCAAYLPKMDHHNIPKIGFNNGCKPQGFLPDIHSGGKKAVTLELCHGNDKQIISLPTDRMDQNKRYYVTFTVKGQSNDSSPSDEKENNNEEDAPHRHSKSV